MLVLQAIAHLEKDPTMANLIAICPPLEFDATPEDAYIYLLSSVVSQQVSAKVAAVIYARFLALFDDNFPEPSVLFAIDTMVLRGVGLSMQKANYLKNIAEFALNTGINNEELALQSNEEIIKNLTTIKGVGVWTVEMVLIFALKRTNVFSVGDLAVRQSAIHLYEVEETGKAQLAKLNEISQQWQPYASFACLYLWLYSDLGLKKTGSLV